MDTSLRLSVQSMQPPAKKEAGKIVESVQELIELLHTEAKVL